MPTISSYALQYSNVNFSAISASTFDLFITEGAPLVPGGGFPGISDPQVGQLKAQGRTVVGYVNVAVTDDARYYWNPSWTSNGEDTGTPIPGQAPSWLDQAVPVDFDGVAGQDALIVEYWDPVWQQIVIEQAVDLIESGYSGVFLDDVGRYFDAGSGSGTVPLMANRMLDFIHAIRTAITAVNPDAIIVTNTNPYIVTDSPDGPFSTRAATYRADVDIHLIENQGTAALDHFATYFAGEPLLILQSVTPAPLTYDQAWARGILYTAPNQAYNSLGTFAYPATAGADTLSGGDGPNQISGLGGNDIIDGGAGADTMDGGAGNDIFHVDNAADSVIEGAGGGFDQVYSTISFALGAGAEVEVLAAGNSASTAALNFIGNEFGQTIFGNAGANVLTGAGGADALHGRGGDDIYSADVQDVVVENAGEGFDQVYALASFTLNAGASVEVIAAGDSASTAALNLFGNEFGQQIFGNAGANTLGGGGGADSLYGRGGDDIYSADGNDVVVENAGEGFDQVYSLSSFTLNAGAQVEVVAAGNSASITALDLVGNEAAQQVFGNAGANILDGRGGADALYGSGGADTFAFTTALGAGNIDAIADFSAADDSIALENAVFAGLPAGPLSAGAFVVGAAAADADDRIVYNQATGQLFFDADGNGPGAQVQFALLNGAPAITAADFTVI